MVPELFSTVVEFFSTMPELFLSVLGLFLSADGFFLRLHGSPFSRDAFSRREMEKFSEGPVFRARSMANLELDPTATVGIVARRLACPTRQRR